MKNVLLVGGTSETGAIAQAFADAGYMVLASTATDMPLSVGEHKNISRHCGRLTADDFEALIKDRGIDLVINAAHPYAQEVRKATREAADHCRVVHLDFMRPALGLDEFSDIIQVACDHAEAAVMAVGAGKNILLTIGTKNLAPYISAAREGGCQLFARVIPGVQSVGICHDAGLTDSQIIFQEGIASFEDNVRIIKDYSVDVLVTKESGEAGGTHLKLAAARRAGCKVIILRRPAYSGIDIVSDIQQLIDRAK